MRYPTRNPFPGIALFLAGFFLAQTGAAPYIRHIVGRVASAVAGLAH